MNFVKYGTKLINLDLVTNINLLKADEKSVSNVIVFEYEKGHEEVISFEDAPFNSAKLELFDILGVKDK